MPNLLINIPNDYFIYILYGSAFLFLGFAIFIKDMKGSHLELADNLWLLGMFGLTHGLHEFLVLYPLIEGMHLALEQIVNVRLLTLVVLIVSFLFLMQFGLSVIQNTRRCTIRPFWFKIAPFALLILWVVSLAPGGYALTMRFLGKAEMHARVLFCLSGAFLTAHGLLTYSHQVHLLSRSVARHLRLAGIAFAFYGVFAGIFVTRFSLIALPVPVELLRGIAAMMITYFIVKALNMFNIETRTRIEQQTKHLIQTEKLTSLGQLAAGIAHEINNPLTNASLGIQTLKLKIQNSGDGMEMIEKLDAVERNIDKASVIARELLQFSRQRESQFSAVNMNALVRGALTLLQYKVKNIQVQQLLSDVPDIRGDAGKLEQVIINILSNAVEAMPGGGVITIETGRSSSGVLLRVKDTGTGIPEENLSRVFDPFFTTKETGRGTGLGLSICYGIIKDHHGTIDVHSVEGRGTTVSIVIPERSGM